MVTAIVHIEAQVDKITQVAEAIAAIDGVSEVYSITGNYDLMAMVRVAAYEDVAAVIPGRINKVPGVLATETHLAFRAYSRHDLEAAFAIGLDETD
jgi:DNA-binding Lrp family transcriptional regulator